MKGSRYRLNMATLGILTAEGRATQMPVTIPMDAIVTAGELVNGNIFVEVMWEGKTFWVFTQDLQARGELVRAATQ